MSENIGDIRAHLGAIMESEQEVAGSQQRVENESEYGYSEIVQALDALARVRQASIALEAAEQAAKAAAAAAAGAATGGVAAAAGVGAEAAKKAAAEADATHHIEKAAEHNEEVAQGIGIAATGVGKAMSHATRMVDEIDPSLAAEIRGRVERQPGALETMAGEAEEIKKVVPASRDEELIRYAGQCFLEIITHAQDEKGEAVTIETLASVRIGNM